MPDAESGSRGLLAPSPTPLPINRDLRHAGRTQAGLPDGEKRGGLTDTFLGAAGYPGRYVYRDQWTELRD